MSARTRRPRGPIVRILVVIGLLPLACSTGPTGSDRRSGALSARPHAPALPCPAGVSRLGVDAARDAILYVPPSVPSSGAPAPLLMFLHGAGGNPARALERMRPLADAKGVILLAPLSRGDTWDAIRGSLGPDVELVDRSLDAAFKRCAVDASHLGISGFSDGASYALTLGLANGDLFTHVVAFSPCLVGRGITPKGTPPVFLSHGRADEILHVEACGRALEKRLRKAGYQVTYDEFDGRHEMPPEVVEAAYSFFLAAR